ncbi:hypothetical protein BGZ65_012834, partial [Modicella reniformis]
NQLVGLERIRNGTAEDYGESLLGPPLGTSLFQDSLAGLSREAAPPILATPPREHFFSTTHFSGFGSDGDWDRSSSFDDDEDGINDSDGRPTTTPRPRPSI